MVRWGWGEKPQGHFLYQAVSLPRAHTLIFRLLDSFIPTLSNPPAPPIFFLKKVTCKIVPNTHNIGFKGWNTWLKSLKHCYHQMLGNSFKTDISSTVCDSNSLHWSFPINRSLGQQHLQGSQSSLPLLMLLGERGLYTLFPIPSPFWLLAAHMVTNSRCPLSLWGSRFAPWPFSLLHPKATIMCSTHLLNKYRLSPKDNRFPRMLAMSGVRARWHFSFFLSSAHTSYGRLSICSRSEYSE